MKLTKESLQQLYDSMSLEEMASHLQMAKSTLYYHMRKLGVQRRSKSEAQSQHLAQSAHQRLGKKHTASAVEKISHGTRVFWESPEGEKQKTKLGQLRRREWGQRSAQQRIELIQRLQGAERPTPGKLSRFGTKLLDFLSTRESVKSGMKLTADHVSDIILVDRKVVIELILPVAVYGDLQASKLEVRYERLIQELNDTGYRVVVIEDKSNSLSQARCQRVYDALLTFFQDNKKHIHITS
jgi:hypothetical protein